MEPQLSTIKLSKITFDETVYPRKEHKPSLVQQYVGDLEQIEAKQNFISVSKNLKLIDGRHRHLAYLTKYKDNPEIEINVYIYDIENDDEIYDLGAETNSIGRYQLSEEDKRRVAIKLYTRAKRDTQKEIARKLSVDVHKVNNWLSNVLKEERERQNSKILDLWMAYYSQQEIADKLNMPQQTLVEKIKILPEKHGNINSVKFNFQDDFKKPLYNTWSYGKKTNEVSHFGNSEQRILENLLCVYTKPFDVVVDNFAGGGSTIDICRKRGRRYWVSDRNPMIAREGEIRKWGVTEGLPPIHRWKDINLVYIDPPYWKQAENKYSKDSTDLANMLLENFTNTLVNYIKGISKKLQLGSVIALLIQPTQWNSPNKEFTDHVFDIVAENVFPESSYGA